MEKTLVTSGKTIDLAIEAALAQLGLDRDSVSVQVLQQAKTGFLGFGAQPAKVQVTYEAPDEVPEAPKVALSSASRKPKAAAPAQRHLIPIYYRNSCRIRSHQACRACPCKARTCKARTCKARGGTQGRSQGRGEEARGAA